MTALSEDEVRYLTQEIRSESTLPLLSWLLRTKQDPETSPTQIFHEVKAGVGVDPRPIPDESEEVEEPMLRLIEKGPGDGTKIKGKPRVMYFRVETTKLTFYR